jgi:hypothetical protein
VAEWLTFTPQPESSFLQDVLPRRAEDRQLGGLEGDLATVGDNLSFPRTMAVVFGSGVNIAWDNALNPFSDTPTSRVVTRRLHTNSAPTRLMYRDEPRFFLQGAESCVFNLLSLAWLACLRRRCLPRALLKSRTFARRSIFPFGPWRPM